VPEYDLFRALDLVLRESLDRLSIFQCGSGTDYLAAIYQSCLLALARKTPVLCIDSLHSFLYPDKVSGDSVNNGVARLIRNSLAAGTFALFCTYSSNEGKVKKNQIALALTHTIFLEHQQTKSMAILDQKEGGQRTMGFRVVDTGLKFL